MPRYHVAREGEEIGVFDEEQLLTALETDQIRLDDDAWAEGMSEWVLVEELVDVEEDEEAPEASRQEVSRLITQAAPPRPKPQITVRPAPVLPTSIEPAPKPAAPRAAPLPTMAPTVYRPVQAGVAPGAYGTPGIAIASLVLGVLSFVLCCFTGVPAIICGHLALGKIKRSAQAYSGEGVAVGGLVLGYLSTVAFIVVVTMMVMGLLPIVGALQQLPKK